MFDATLRDVAVQRLALKVELPEALRRGAVPPRLPADHGRRERGSARLRGADPLAAIRSAGLVSPARVHPGGRGDRARSSTSAAGCSRRPAGRRSSGTGSGPSRSRSASTSPGVQLHQPGFVDDAARILRSDRARSVAADARADRVGPRQAPAGRERSSASCGDRRRHRDRRLRHRVLVALLPPAVPGDEHQGRPELRRRPRRPRATPASSAASSRSATRFGLTTVAEGVETAEQLEVLRRARLRPRPGLTARPAADRRARSTACSRSPA